MAHGSFHNKHLADPLERGTKSKNVNSQRTSERLMTHRRQRNKEAKLSQINMLDRIKAGMKKKIIF